MTYKKILSIALPIVIGSIAENIVSITDTIFLARLNKSAIGAAGNANLFHFIFVLVGSAFTIGTQLLIGQKNGAKQYTKIGKLVYTTLLSMLFLALVFFLLMFFGAPFFFEKITSSSNINELACSFIKVRSFGIFFAFIYFTINSFFIGITKTSVLSITTIIMAGTNVILDYCLIFGNWGLPSLGMEGAAYASVIAEIVATIFILGYFILKIDQKKYGIKIYKRSLKTLKQISHLSYASMIDICIGMMSWFAFFSIIEHIGETELAASHIIKTLYMLLMIPLWGLSSAMKTIISNLIGAKQRGKIFTAIKRTTFLGISSVIVTFIGVHYYGTQLIKLFTDDTEIIYSTTPVLDVIKFTAFIFCLGILLSSSIIGLGKTLHALYIQIITISLYIASAYLITFHFNASLADVWKTEFVYFGSLSLFSIIYLYYSKNKWRIEQI